jgi:hypothetical protein
MTTSTYPVHVDADLDPGLSRWLWIFKWLLAIPHYIVLAFLWLAFVVLSIVAFFAILITGRYPRSIFEFNVGVLRWSWRVAYYAYGALGTDRYPPFTLHEVPDYPAHLEVEFPEHLSRGLVLVKWWLLAIPHYIVVGLLLGGAGYAVSGGTDDPAVWGAGLIGVLVLVAAVILLFTGRYPQQLFDLVLGLNRWVLRVAGYVSLMTDKYPPFALDQGGHEGGDGREAALLIGPPSSAGGTAPAPTPATTPSQPAVPPAGQPPTSGRSGWTAGRVVSLVAGAVLAFVALGSGIAGFALLAADQTARDSDGFLMSPDLQLKTSTYAIQSTPMQIRVDAAASFVPETLLGDAKLTGTAESGGEVFVGYGPANQVRRYLAGVEHATLVDITDNGNAVLRRSAGSAPAQAPEQMDFWVAQSSGTGQQQITWPVENGDWTAVVMNADASPGVSVETTAGAEVPALQWLIGILLIAAAITLVASILLIAIPTSAAGRAQPAQPA